MICQEQKTAHTPIALCARGWDGNVTLQPESNALRATAAVLVLFCSSDSETRSRHIRITINT